MYRVAGRQFSTSSKLNRLFHSQWKRNNVDLPDHVKTMDSISAEEWNKGTRGFKEIQPRI